MIRIDLDKDHRERALELLLKLWNSVELEKTKLGKKTTKKPS